MAKRVRWPRRELSKRRCRRPRKPPFLFFIHHANASTSVLRHQEFGFITPDGGGKDIFCSKADLVDSSDLQEGEPVIFVP